MKRTANTIQCFTVAFLTVILPQLTACKKPPIPSQNENQSASTNSLTAEAATSNGAQQLSQQPDSAPKKPSKLLDKDSEYITLITAPDGMEQIDFLKRFSPTFCSQLAHFQTSVQGMSDASLKQAAIDDFVRGRSESIENEAETNLAVQRRNYLNRHKNLWFVLADFSEYIPETKLMWFHEANNSIIKSDFGGIDVTVPIDLITADAIFKRFKEANSQRIEEEIASDREITSALYSNAYIRRNAADPPSDQRIAEESAEKVEQRQVVLVGLGDIQEQQLTKVFIIDEESEDVLYEVPVAQIAGQLKWRPEK